MVEIVLGPPGTDDGKGVRIMTGAELRMRAAGLYELDLAIAEYLKMSAVTSVTLFFNGYTAVGIQQEAVHDVKNIVMRRAASVVREKVLQLQSVGVDATSELPEELR